MNPDILKKLKEMQKKMVEAQEILSAKEFFGKHKGVTIVMQGTRQMIDIDFNLQDLDDIDDLKSSIVFATNEALKKIEDETKEKMGVFSIGLEGLEI